MFRKLALAALMSGAAGQALACSDLNGVMAHFEAVKDAYLAKAATMKPEQFPIWTGHLETWSAKMQEQDFAGACAVLDTAATELGFDVALSGAGGGAVAATPSDQGSGSGSVSIGSGVSVGSGVVIGSGSGSGTADQGSGAGVTAPSTDQDAARAPIRVRTRPRPER